MKFKAFLCLAVLVGFWHQGCSEETPILPSNLDRPTDVALACRVGCPDPEEISGFVWMDAPMGDCEDLQAERVERYGEICPDMISGGVPSFHTYAFVLNTVTQADVGELSVIDIKAGILLDLDALSPGYSRIPVGMVPVDVEVAPEGKFVYVTNMADHTITQVAVADLAAVRTIPVPGAPQKMTIAPARDSPGEGVAYITLPQEGAVISMDLVDGRVLDRAHVGGLPDTPALWLSPPGEGDPQVKRLYVSNSGEPVITVFELDPARPGSLGDMTSFPTYDLVREGPEGEGELVEVTQGTIAFTPYLPRGDNPSCPDPPHPVEPFSGRFDLDGDGLENGCDPDIDGDGLLNVADGCPYEAEAEDCGADRDGDGVPDKWDNCPDIANPRQADLDGNGVGNVCDSHSAPFLYVLQKETSSVLVVDPLVNEILDVSPGGLVSRGLGIPIPGAPEDVTFGVFLADEDPSTTDLGGVVAFVSSDDGRVYVIDVDPAEGQPAHQLHDSNSESVTSVTQPELFLDDREIKFGDAPETIYPSIDMNFFRELYGAGVFEACNLAETSDHGICVLQPERELVSESWSITYQGRIPEASGNSAKLTREGDQIVLRDTEMTLNLCTAGVEVGDRLVLTSAPEPAKANLDCSAYEEPGLLIVEAYANKLVLQEDRDQDGLAECPPCECDLDPEACDEGCFCDDMCACPCDLEARECDQGCVCDPYCEFCDRVLDRSLPDLLSCYSSLVSFEVRVGQGYSVVGSVTGFLHPVEEDPAGQCVIDPLREGVWEGRAKANQVYEDGTYLEEPMVFTNPFFSLVLREGCQPDPILGNDASEVCSSELNDRQDLRWTFGLISGYVPFSGPVGVLPMGLVYSPADTRLIVTDTAGETVYDIIPQTMEALRSFH